MVVTSFFPKLYQRCGRSAFAMVLKKTPSRARRILVPAMRRLTSSALLAISSYYLDSPRPNRLAPNFASAPACRCLRARLRVSFQLCQERGGFRGPIMPTHILGRIWTARLRGCRHRQCAARASAAAASARSLPSLRNCSTRSQGRSSIDRAPASRSARASGVP